MEWIFQLQWLLTCGLPVLLLAVGWALGTLGQHLHERKLERAEQRYQDLLVTDTALLPTGVDAAEARVVVGSTVVASDHFRTLAARIRMFFGGEVGFYVRLIERGRREARYRMLEQARQAGAVAVINTRMQSSNLAGMESRRAGGAMVELIAYGTAIVPRDVSGIRHSGGY